MDAPSGHLTKVGQSEGAARGLGVPPSQRACSCPLRAQPLAPLGPLVGSLLIVSVLDSAQMDPCLCPSLDFCTVQGHIPVLGDPFLWPPRRSVSWLIVPLPPSLPASACDLRINTFIHTHACVHTNFKIIWLPLSAEMFRTSLYTLTTGDQLNMLISDPQWDTGDF